MQSLRRPPPVALVLGLAMVLALLTACQRDRRDANSTPTEPLADMATPVATATPTPVPTPSPTPTPTAADYLRRAGERMSDLESFAFLLTHQGGATALDSGLGVPLLVEQAKGVVKRPNSMQTEVAARAQNLSVTLRTVVVDGTTYMADPFTGQWRQVRAEVNPLSFFDPLGGVRSIMQQVQDPQLVGVERVGGADARHIRGKLPARALASLLSATGEGTVDADLWLDAQADHLRRAELRGPINPGEPADIMRTVELSRFNEPVTIAPPG